MGLLAHLKIKKILKCFGGTETECSVVCWTNISSSISLYVELKNIMDKQGSRRPVFNSLPLQQTSPIQDRCMCQEGEGAPNLRKYFAINSAQTYFIDNSNCVAKAMELYISIKIPWWPSSQCLSDSRRCCCLTSCTTLLSILKGVREEARMRRIKALAVSYGTELSGA